MGNLGELDCPFCEEAREQKARCIETMKGLLLSKKILYRIEEVRDDFQITTWVHSVVVPFLNVYSAAVTELEREVQSVLSNLRLNNTGKKYQVVFVTEEVIDI